MFYNYFNIFKDKKRKMVIHTWNLNRKRKTVIHIKIPRMEIYGTGKVEY